MAWEGQCGSSGVKATHGTGNCPYDLMPLKWELVEQFLAAKGINGTDGPWATTDQELSLKSKYGLQPRLTMTGNDSVC